jgi:hypothetical protein
MREKTTKYHKREDTRQPQGSNHFSPSQTTARLLARCYPENSTMKLKCNTIILLIYFY